METLKALNADHTRKVPADAPTSFVRKRWEGLVFTEAGVDRRFYELCTLSELKNALRSGDIWVQGSRQFKDFDEYLVPAENFAALKQAGELPLAREHATADTFLHERLLLLERAARRRQPHGAGRRTARRDHHRVRLEDHAADQRGARGSRRPDAAGLRRCCRTSRSPTC